MTWVSQALAMIHSLLLFALTATGWITIEMLREGWVAPTRGLERVDPRCGDLDYVRGAPRDLAVSVAMTNNFAFGGVNTSILLALPDAS